MTVIRSAKIKRQPSTTQGTPGVYVSDSGYSDFTIERPYLDDKPDISCEKPGIYLCVYQWSPRHNCNNYHMITMDGRSDIEHHPLNVMEESEGCIGHGKTQAIFKASSIRPGMPSMDCPGVTDSVSAIAAFEADMRDKVTGEQMPFMLTIE